MRIRGRYRVAFALPLVLGLCAVPTVRARQTAPAAGEAFRVSRWVRPHYSDDAIDRNVTGDVEIEFSVAPDGTLLSADAVSGPDALRADAERAARLWRFARRKPGRAPDGPVSLRVTFSFTEEYGGHYATLALSDSVLLLAAPVSLADAEGEDASAEGVAASQPDGASPASPGDAGGGAGSGEGVGVGPGPAAAPAPAPASPDSIATRAKILNSPRVGYTDQARQNKTGGNIRLRVLLGADGTIKQVDVVSGLPDGLNAKAVEAARQFEFEPARDADGNPVDSWTPLVVNFKIR